MAKILPTKIEEAVNGTPVLMLAKVVDPKSIEAFIAIELTKLREKVNVDDRLNLQGHQIPEIAEFLMTTYRNENLADFTICFKNGAMGKYGEIFRLDGAVIMRWMGFYLEEKYQVIENNLMKEKDKPYDFTGTNTRRADGTEFSVDEFLEKWKQSIGYEQKDTSNAKENAFQADRVHHKQMSDEEIIKREMHRQYFSAKWKHDQSVNRDGKNPFLSESDWLELNK